MASKSWFKFENKAGEDCTTVCIYDEISAWGITAKDFIAELDGVKTKSITLKINSPGGNVFDGITIHNALKSHAATVNVLVEGLAASIASIIAMAGDEIRMAKNSFMMIHRASSIEWGNEEAMTKMAETLKKIDNTLLATYQARTGGKAEDIKQIMQGETWLTADECLASGFCDCVGDPAEVKAHFDLSKFSNTPQAVTAMNIITKPENERDLETILRDSGLSRKEALTAVASLKAEALRDSGAEENQQIANAILKAAAELKTVTAMRS